VQIPGLGRTLIVKLASNILMIHSWAVCVSRGPWNPASWYISTLFLYWIFSDFLFWLMARVRTPIQRYCLLALCWIWASIGTVVQHHDSIQLFNIADEQGQYFANFRFTHPAAHVQSFFAGMILADVYRSTSQVQPHPMSTSSVGGWAEMWWRWRATATVAFIMLLFRFYTPWRFYAFWFNGGLLPIHACLLFGLMTNEDALAQLWSRRPFVTLGGYSYAMYITQVVAADLSLAVTTKFGVKLDTARFYNWAGINPIIHITAVVFCTVIGHHAIEQPAVKLYKSFNFARCFGCCHPVDRGGL